MNDESPCTPIAQNLSLKSCFSGCLESFLSDNKRPKTQHEMVALGKAHKPQKLCDDGGVVPDGRMKDYCALFGIGFEKTQFENIPQKIKNGEGFLIGCWNYQGDKSKQHCVRFCRHIGEEKFLVMNPTGGVIEEWQKKTIAEWRCEVFRICLAA